MRYNTTHLLFAVFVAAFLFALVRHPEVIWALVAPLIGGCFIVVPVLGAIELLGGRDSATPQIGWAGSFAIAAIGIVGAILAVVTLSILVLSR